MKRIDKWHALVESGDTITSISTALQVTAAQLRTANHTSSSNTYFAKPGDVIHVPSNAVAYSGTPEAPSTSKYPWLIGGTMDMYNNPVSTVTSHETAVTNFESIVGGKINCTRRFLGGQTNGIWPSFTSTYCNTDTGLRHRVVSLKGAPLATGTVSVAAFKTFITTIPKDNFLTGLAINHEPDQSGGRVPPATHKQQSAMLLQAIKESGRTDVFPVSPIVMTWWENDNNSATSSAQYFPDNPSEFVLGIDPYNISGTKSIASQFPETISLWKAAGGTHWLICECGSHAPDPEAQTEAAKAADIAELAGVCKADAGCVGILWFHSGVGPFGGWWMKSGAAATEFGKLLTFKR